MSKTNKKTGAIFGAVAIIALAAAFSIFNSWNSANIDDAKAASADNIKGWAWSENVGWISFNSINCDTDGDGISDAGLPCPAGNIPDYGVNMAGGGELSGYAWNENIGWITFDKAVAGNPPGAPYNGGQLFMAKKNGSDEFEGWARAISACKNDLWDGIRCTGNGAGDKSGGWDGWIKLRKDPADAGANYGVSLNGTDFEGWAWGGDVVGWVSFNSKNCDTDNNTFIDAGVCGGDNATTPVINYKVYLTNTNNNPTASNLAISADYCATVPVRTFSWEYNDPDSDDESQFQLQIDDNSDFSSSEVSICGDGSAPLPTGNCSAPGALSVPNGSVNFKNINVMESPGANQLGFNKTYYWRVRVWDSIGGSSGWAEYDPDANPLTQNPIGTPLHSYPNAHFTCSPDLAVSCPADHDILELITFDNDPDPGANPNPDRYGPYTFNWDFCKGAACPNKNAVGIPANHTYITEGSYDVELTVSDATLPIDGGPYICAFSQTLNIVSARPKWNEINP